MNHHSNQGSSLTPKHLKKSPKDWSLCLFCEKSTDEELICPALNQKTHQGWQCGYSDLVRDLNAYNASVENSRYYIRVYLFSIISYVRGN